MRVALWLLVLSAVAVAAALFAGSNPGSVTVFWPPYRVDLSLNLVLVLLVMAFFVVHAALRAMGALFSMPAAALRWRVRQRERQMHASLVDAIAHLYAGRFVRARKAAEGLLVQVDAVDAREPLEAAPRLRALAHLLAAEATHQLQDRSSRDSHAEDALRHASGANAIALREGVQLRATRWAIDDRDPARALSLLDAMAQGVARRTLALRLRLKAARIGRSTLQGLESARLLAKHRALSPLAATGVLRGLAIELLEAAQDPQQLEQAWEKLDSAERAMPEVAIHAAGRLQKMAGSPSRALGWLLPVWELLAAQPPALEESQRLALVRVLERGFSDESVAPDPAWLARIERAQMQRPADPLLQYLAGTACLRLQLWGKAKHLLSQSCARLGDADLQADAWRRLAELARRDGDAEAELNAWRSAAALR